VESSWVKVSRSRDAGPVPRLIKEFKVLERHAERTSHPSFRNRPVRERLLRSRMESPMPIPMCGCMPSVRNAQKGRFCNGKSQLGALAEGSQLFGVGFGIRESIPHRVPGGPRQWIGRPYRPLRLGRYVTRGFAPRWYRAHLWCLELWLKGLSGVRVLAFVRTRTANTGISPLRCASVEMTGFWVGLRGAVERSSIPHPLQKRKG